MPDTSQGAADEAGTLDELERLHAKAVPGRIGFDSYSSLVSVSQIAKEEALPDDATFDEGYLAESKVFSVPRWRGDTAKGIHVANAKYLECLWNAAPSLISDARQLAALREQSRPADPMKRAREIADKCYDASDHVCGSDDVEVMAKIIARECFGFVPPSQP